MNVYVYVHACACVLLCCVHAHMCIKHCFIEKCLRRGDLQKASNNRPVKCNIMCMHGMCVCMIVCVVRVCESDRQRHLIHWKDLQEHIHNKQFNAIECSSSAGEMIELAEETEAITRRQWPWRGRDPGSGGPSSSECITQTSLHIAHSGLLADSLYSIEEACHVPCRLAEDRVGRVCVCVCILQTASFQRLSSWLVGSTHIIVQRIIRYLLGRENNQATLTWNTTYTSF